MIQTCAFWLSDPDVSMVSAFLLFRIVGFLHSCSFFVLGWDFMRVRLLVLMNEGQRDHSAKRQRESREGSGIIRGNR